MPNYSENEIVLIRYPFSDLSNAKIRPAVVINAPHISRDLILVALTSRTTTLLPGEFVLKDWTSAGLNIETAVKRGIFTIHDRLVLKSVGSISPTDSAELELSLREWLGL
ncbi:MAG: type II toxin-antitoxin system PemK/MazF family toxin [Pyrinomonadaceae bacterium]